MENQMTSNQIEEIWTTVSMYLPERVKLDCAIDYVKTLVDIGVDPDILKQVGDIGDKRLEEAVAKVLDTEIEEDEEEYYEDQ